MGTSDPQPDTDPVQTADESTDDQPENPPETTRERIPATRRTALLTLLGLGGLGLTGGRVAATHRGQHWRRDVDADGNSLFDLGSLATRDNASVITDFEGRNLVIDGDGVLNATDTRADVSDEDGIVVSQAEDIVAGSGLAVTASPDETSATIDVGDSLDADTLEGAQKADLDSQYVDASGDTVSGSLTLQSFYDLEPISEPPPPSTGKRVFVDNADDELKVKDTTGQTTTLSSDNVGLSAWNTSHQTIPHDSEETIVFDGINRDDFDGYDDQTGVYTVAEAGDYHVSFMIRWKGFFGHDIVNHRLRVNGSTDRGIRWVKTVEHGAPDRAYSKSIFGLEPGDTMRVTVKQFSEADREITGFSDEESTYLTIHKIG